jgi:hypothetical protein
VLLKAFVPVGISSIGANASNSSAISPLINTV